LQKAKALQLCRTRLAVFCADRLVEEGYAAGILDNPVHPYTEEWLNLGTNSGQRKSGVLWQYCKPNCKEQHSCPAKQSKSSVMWDCGPGGLHKVICRGFF
jgi:ABC-type dipeptide/oligopeptide/nickel transport system ATPase component